MALWDITERGLPSPALDNTLPDGYKKGVCYDDQRQAHRT